MAGDATGSKGVPQPPAGGPAIDPARLARARWFAGKGRRIARLDVADSFPVPGAIGGGLVLLDVAYDDGDDERYLLPVAGLEPPLVDAPPEHPLWPALARAAAAGVAVQGRHGVVEGHPAGAPAPLAAGAARPLTDDQSNTSVVLGEQVVVKCYRRLEAGVHPEPELLAALTAGGCRHAPELQGRLRHRSPAGETALAVVYRFVPGRPVGWEPIISALAAALGTGEAEALADDASALGAAAASIHEALADALGVETASADDAAAAVRAAEAQLDRALAALPADDPIRELAPTVRERLARLERLTGAPLTRVHGDLHVAQFVRAADGVVAVDFEGEPGRPLTERRRPTSPLRDLACLLLSLDHVAVAAARRRPELADAQELARGWAGAARGSALHAYEVGIAGSALGLDRDLLPVLELEKECRELLYAATVLPEWLYAPRATLPRLLATA